MNRVRNPGIWKCGHCGKLVSGAVSRHEHYSLGPFPIDPQANEDPLPVKFETYYRTSADWVERAYQ